MKSINPVVSGSEFIHDAPMLGAPTFLETGTARKLKALTRTSAFAPRRGGSPKNRYPFAY